MNKKKVKEYAISYSFLLPFAVFFITFTLIPIGYVFYLSLHDGNFLQAHFDWVGLKNFKDVLESPDFRKAFINTFIYMLIEVPVSQILAIFIAMLIRKKTKFTHFCEIVYFMPMLLSMVVASVLISYIFRLLSSVVLCCNISWRIVRVKPFICKGFSGFLSLHCLVRQYIVLQRGFS